MKAADVKQERLLPGAADAEGRMSLLKKELYSRLCHGERFQ